MENFDEKMFLAKFKLSIGDLTPGDSGLDSYYEEQLTQAAAILRSNDISETVLSSELGKATIVMYAKTIMDGKDVATDNTCVLLRNTLSVQTKGERYADGN